MKSPPIESRARKGQPLGMPPARFLRDYWQKRSLLIRGAFPEFQPPLSPDDLAGLACMEGALARIILRGDGKAKSLGSGFRAARGPGMTAKRSSSLPRKRSSLPRKREPSDFSSTWQVHSGPFDESTFAQLPESNWTLLVQDVDKWDADTAALLDHFRFIPSWRIDDVMISYATDGGGVGAHVDQYDVFLLQGLGQRRWSIDTRPNPPTAFREDVELKLLERFSPTHTWMLEPGDMLYLPPGVPHDGVAVGECTTFSIGMRAPAAGELLFDFAAHLAETLPESQRFADPDLQPARAAGEIDDAALRRARRALGPVAATLNDEAFADWFGAFVTRYRVAQVAAPRKRRIDRATLAERLPHASLECDPWSRFAWRRHGRGARLYVAGNVFDAPIAWAKALASGPRRIDGSRLALLPEATPGVALIAALIDAGHVTLRRR
ncbi:MAG TPA: cupin domain-containing protein [Rhodanobacteraceae bacterium]|nr:cupin domain-containing protein [Rhodanobacteraceae bacterium]